MTSDAALADAIRELHDRGAQWVVITAGAGPLWVSGEGRVERITPPPPVSVVNPIGSGDCLAAGVAWGLSTGHDPWQAVRLGVAAAVENVVQLLPGRIDPVCVGRLAETLRGVPV